MRVLSLSISSEMVMGGNVTWRKNACEGFSTKAQSRILTCSLSRTPFRNTAMVSGVVTSPSRTMFSGMRVEMSRMPPPSRTAILQLLLPISIPMRDTVAPFCFVSVYNP